MAPLEVLLRFIGICAFVSGQSPTYGLKGLMVSLKPHVAGDPDAILWKHNSNKVVEFYGTGQDVYGLYKNRVTLGWVSAELNITDLKYEDSGEYELEVYTNQVLTRTTYKLEVIDKVAKPNISCERISGSTTHGNQATLTCSSEARQPQFLTYEWVAHGASQPGQRLAITLSDKHDNEEYVCSVRNPLSSETATFATRDCYPGAGPSVALMVGISVLPVLAIVVLALGVIRCKLKHKACFANDPEKAPYTRESVNKETASETDSLLHRTPTVPSGQRLADCPQRDNVTPNVPDGIHTGDGENMMPEKVFAGTVKKRIEEIELQNTIRTDSKNTPSDLDNNADNANKTFSPPLPVDRKLSFDEGEGSDTVPSNDKDTDVDTGQLNAPESSDSKQGSEPEATSVLEVGEDLQSGPAPEQPEPVTGADEDGHEKPPANMDCPSPMPHLRQPPPKVGTKDTADEDNGSDQVRDRAEEDDIKKSHSSGLLKTNDPDIVSEEKQSPTIPQLSNMPQQETRVTQSNDQMDKPDSDLTESDNQKEGESNKEKSNTGVFQDSQNAHSHLDKEKGDKTRRDSHGCEEQSDSSKAKGEKAEDKGETGENEGRRSPNENQLGKESEDE